MTDLTPDQKATLADLADKIRAGRQVATWIIHMFAVVGGIATAAAAVITVISAWRGH